MIESSLVVYKNEIICATRGQPAEVEFDFDAVWAFKNKNKKTFNSEELAWFHVHPPNFGTEPSQKDIECAKGLDMAFCGIGLFAIICFNNDFFADPGGSIAWYQFDSFEGKLFKVCDMDLALGIIERPNLVERVKWLTGGHQRKYIFAHEVAILKALSCCK